jgi:hypothetical protein
LITSHSDPSPSFIVDIGALSSVIVPVPYLSTEEIGELIAKVGQEGRLWSPIVQLMSGGGHPQLVQASIAVLEAKGWPREEFANLIMGTPEIEQERVIARQRLIEALPDPVRASFTGSALSSGKWIEASRSPLPRSRLSLSDREKLLNDLSARGLIGWPETSFGCRRWSLMRGSRCWARRKLWPFGIRSSNF